MVHAWLQALPGQDAKEALDQIHPGGVGRRRVTMHSGMAGQPVLGRFVFVNVQVIQNQVQVDLRAGRHDLVQLAEVRRCRTSAKTSPVAILRAAKRVCVPWRTYSLVQARGFLALSGSKGWVRSRA